MALDIGDSIPTFSLADQDGTVVRSEDLRGKPTVIYFYPKDNTVGCTAEACAFRDQYSVFTDAGAQVYGISSDSPESHKSFAKEYRLPFGLLSDRDGQVRELFGVKKTLGLIDGRVTFVFDREGVLRHRFSSQLLVTKHVAEAAEVIRSLA